MKNVMDTLRERGFIKQTVYEEDLYKLLSTESVAFYVGFDPTADSLHVGHYVQLVAMRHMQLAGHKPIVLIGGGTGMVGDPSGRTDMRMLMTAETVQNNCDAFRVQMSKFINFEGENAAVMVNNADWLLKLNYIDFMREIGVHFSVNKMLTADCFKQRMEKGLSFFEFNYMLMQAYDFLVLHDKYKCCLQLGGDDQWSNILAGADLIRKKRGEQSYAMTFALLSTSDGKKMGKTAKGAVWLDPKKTTPYEFYQYFRNVDDADINKCLKLLTFVPVEEIEELTKHHDERMNAAKERLAYEVTKLIHGGEQADKAKAQSVAAFISGDISNMPAVKLSKETGKKVIDILVAAKLAPSKGEARRLIDGKAVSVEDILADNVAFEVPDEIYSKGEFVLHKGKKTHVKVVLI